MFVAMSRRKAVQFSRAGLNAGSGGGGDGGDDDGGGGKVVKESVKKTSLKEGRERRTAFVFANLFLIMSWLGFSIDFILSAP